MPPLWAQYPGLLRGLDLTRASADATIDQLQLRLKQRPPRRLDAPPPLLRAGVLVPLLRSGEEVKVLFTRRTDTVLTHKGQISFPGGQRESSDANLVETALRESYEEIGLDPSSIDVVGELDDVFTSVSGYVVTPVVGMVRHSMPALTLAPAEVKSVFTVPISRLHQVGVHTTETRTLDGQPFRIHYFQVGDDLIWGVTGYILDQFLRAWTEAAIEAVSQSRS